MKHLVLSLILFLPLTLFAQKAWVADNHSEYPVDGKVATLLNLRPHLSADTSKVSGYLLENLPNLRAQGSNLVLENFRRSPKAVHMQFAQTFNGRKVFRGAVKVNMRPDGHVLSIFDHTFTVPDDVETAFPDHEAYHAGLMVHYDHGSNGRLERYSLEETYYPNGETLIPAIRLEVLEQTDRYYEMLLNADVKVIYQNDLLTYFAPPPQDSLVTLWVFHPDPVTSAQQQYGSPYSDQDDQDIPELNAERMAVQALVTFDNGTFTLKNSAVEIKEFSSPTTDPAVSTTNEFNFTRSEAGFEDCNALYHITEMRGHIHQLGFTDLMDYAIHVDAHALNGSDNSNFNPGSNPPRLSFGEGGVDDAEDADVIVHEYGHAIMHSAAPNTNTGVQRMAMDEAIGDYFAASYSRHINDFRWADVFTWDGHNEFWSGRSAVSSDHYPEDLDNNLYLDADIWSATLMEIWGDIGRDATDATMLQAAYSFTSGMTMAQAATVFAQADTLLTNGAHAVPIIQRMCNRGLIDLMDCEVGIDETAGTKSPFQVTGTVAFANGTGSVLVSGPAPFNVTLTDALGRTILYERSVASRHELSADGLSAGIYILTVDNGADAVHVKLMK